MEANVELSESASPQRATQAFLVGESGLGQSLELSLGLGVAYSYRPHERALHQSTPRLDILQVNTCPFPRICTYRRQ